MKVLTKEALLKKDELKREFVQLDADGSGVYVRQWNAHEKDTFERSLLKEGTDDKGRMTLTRDPSDFRSKLVVSTCCDADGKNIFEPDDWKDIRYAMSASKIEKLVEVSQRLNAITPGESDEEVKK